MIVTVAEACAVASPPPTLAPAVCPGPLADVGSDVAVGIAACDEASLVSSCEVVMVTALSRKSAFGSSPRLQAERRPGDESERLLAVSFEP